MLRVPAAAVLAVLSVLLAACASGPPGRGLGGVFDGGWEKGAVVPHAALRSDVALSTWTRGLGPAREVRRALDTPEGEIAPRSLRELAAYVVPPTSPRAAQRYAELAQLLGVEGVAIPGEPVVAGDDPGGNGTYGPADAAGWEIPYDPEPQPFGAGFEVQTVVLVPPQQHEMLAFSTPWRLVLVTQVVYPDGGLRASDRRTLTNGDSAERYARF